MYQAHAASPRLLISPPWAEATDLVVFSAENAHYATFALRPPLRRKSQGHFRRSDLKLEETLQL